MNPEIIRDHCLTLKGAIESFPFGENTLVFKVMGKMFALISLDELRINLKCDPELAITLREQFTSVTPGYHMNKKYWITVQLDGSVPVKIIFNWITHSYSLVVESLTAKLKDELKLL